MLSQDYAEPIIKYGGLRSRVTSKAYIAVFVCTSTIASHLKLVTALTSQAFLAAFSRFTGRRGVPASICSDNATNFVGADRELRELYAAFSSTDITSGCYFPFKH